MQTPNNDLARETSQGTHSAFRAPLNPPGGVTFSEGRWIMATEETYGLVAGMRVVEADAGEQIEGEIRSVDAETHTAWVLWDNGHDAFRCDLDDLVPVNGW
jgi:hypothetical protein